MHKERAAPLRDRVSHGLRTISKGPRRTALVSAVLSAGVLALIYFALAAQFEASLVNRQRARMETQLSGYVNALSTAISRRLVLLQGLRAFSEGELIAHGEIPKNVFENVAGGLFESSQGTHSIWLAPNGVQTFVYPPNTPDVGVDLLHTNPPDKALDAMAAINSHETVVSLPQVGPQGLEMEARLAIYSQSHFWGLVTITLDLPAIFKEVGLEEAARSVQLGLRDGRGQVLFGDAGVFTSDPVISAVNFPGGSWSLAALPVGGWTNPIQDVLWLVRLIGLAATLMVGTLIYLSVDRQTRLELAVSERTRQLDRELAERKRVEQDLRDNEEKYRTLVETSADAVLLQTPTGQIVDCNSAACRLFGYSRDEFALLETGDLVPENVARLLPKEVTKELTTGGAFVETVYKRRNNRLFSAEVSSQMISMGGAPFVIAYIRDITQRKQAEEAIRESEERYRSLFETSPDAIALTDLRSIVRLCNQKAAQVFDFDSPEQMVGINVFDLIAPEDRQNAIDSTREVFKGAILRDLEYVAISNKGRRFPCELSASTIYDKAGKPKGFTGILRDITERKQKARENIAVVVIASALRMAVTLDEISQSILNQLLGVLGAEGAAIFKAIPATGEALCVRGVGRWQHWTSMRLDRDEGLTSRVIRYGQAFVNNDIIHNKQTARLELTGGLNAVAGAPLISKERTIGALWVGRNQPFREGEQQILMVIADMVANAVQRASLYEDLYNSNRELEESYDRTLEGWSRAMDLRDRETEDHNQRVAEETVQLAGLMGIEGEALVHIRRGALLHDIGKIGIPDLVLHKTGKLTDTDWLTMRRHPEYARDFLEPIPYLRPAMDIPYCHHEHWDGSGYPRGLRGEDIPLAARIFSVIDVWDALTHDRVYRPRWGTAEARDYIRENAGVLFDPRVVEAFFKMIG